MLLMDFIKFDSSMAHTVQGLATVLLVLVLHLPLECITFFSFKKLSLLQAAQ